MKKIAVRGARTHNLKNLDVDIPRDQLVVITGLSGSGKSSLAFDTIFAEGQRRYVESLSTYARQFLDMTEKPDVDNIEGLSPSISIDQKTASRNPRSTVGTVTEIYDFLRLLYAKIGTVHCYKCGEIVTSQSIEDIVAQINTLPASTKIIVLAPLIKGKKGEHKAILTQIQKDGFVRLRVDGELMSISDEIKLDKNKAHTIEVVVDRLVIKEDPSSEDILRLSESVEIATRLADGTVIILQPDDEKEMLYSEKFACAACGVSMNEVTPKSFSFNSPHGACYDCHGLGVKNKVDRHLVMPNPRLTLAEGAVIPWGKTASRLAWYNNVLEAVGKKYKFDINTPVGELSEEAIDIVMKGTGDETFKVKQDGKVLELQYEGVMENLEKKYVETDSDYVRKEIKEFMKEVTCPTCEGARLRPESLAVRVGGKSIIEMTTMQIDEAHAFCNDLNLTDTQLQIAKMIFKEINDRLSFLMRVGLNYLTLNRSAATLSGGEAQRIRLATQIGSQLQGVLYVLDEPSIGLHQRDNSMLIDTLKNLRDLGNSVIVVEHDEETMDESDYLIDIGPGAGADGGTVIAHGTPDEVKKDKNSVTGQYLSGKKQIEMPKKRREGTGQFLEIHGARENNLKNVDLKLPLGTFLAITGVSGSGKSTLINRILAKVLLREYHRAKTDPGEHDKMEGIEHLDKIINIDQSPIGRTPRSNPATYTGVFTEIRDLFAKTPESKLRGYDSGRFSFNVKGGRCETCKGDGVTRIEMHFLPDVYVTCETCKGARYNKQALEILYKGKTIAEVLNMTISEALEFFDNIPKVKKYLEVLDLVGLGYVKLGQSATTLSGGEAQRIKLATELARASTGKTLYVLDEPTTGLHFADVDRLINVLQKLVDQGNTVLTIEHNLDVVKCVDWVVDMGPDGGDAGGQIVAEGTPEHIADQDISHTGRYLKKLFGLGAK